MRLFGHFSYMRNKAKTSILTILINSQYNKQNEGVNVVATT